MKVRECMTRAVRIANPDETLRDAAKAMAEMHVRALPVGENDRLVGMITGRDIAVRGLAEGGNAKVRDIMTTDVKYAFEDQDIEEVLQNMGDIKVRRLPVVNRDKRLVGIISLDDAAQSKSEDGRRGAKRNLRARWRERGTALTGLAIGSPVRCRVDQLRWASSARVFGGRHIEHGCGESTATLQRMCNP
jgi:CBS-domain-containing membrane protein